MLHVTVGNVHFLSLPMLRAAVWAFWDFCRARLESTWTSISERVSDNLLDEADKVEQTSK